jgi:iron-sulfur cluster assembly protein
MNVSIYDPTENTPITLTPTAIAHIKKEIQKNKALGFRFGVKKAGCSGFKYVIDFVFETIDSDHVLPIGSDFDVYIDKESFPVLQGITIDYVREGLNGRLKFINPNEKNSCGCGESFGV